MPPFLSQTERSHLRAAAHLAPDREHRRRCRILLWLDRGAPVARVCRGFGVSRPVAYRLKRLWQARRDVGALHPAVSRAELPWRAGGGLTGLPGQGNTRTEP